MSTPKAKQPPNYHTVRTCTLCFRQDSGFFSFHRKHLWAERKEQKEIFHTRVHSEVPGKATNTLNLNKMMDEHVSNLLGRKSADLLESQMGCVYTHTHTHTHTHTRNYCQNSTHSDRRVLNEEKMRPICGWWARILEVFYILLLRFSLKTDMLLWVWIIWSHSYFLFSETKDPEFPVTPLRDFDFIFDCNCVLLYWFCLNLWPHFHDN